MFRAVVFIACLAAALLDVHCQYTRFNCKPNYYKKQVGNGFYCYTIYKITKDDTLEDKNLRNITRVDQDICRNSPDTPTRYSTSIRTRGEFEFVKMLYRTFEKKKWRIHADRSDLPLLIGLTYINHAHRWFDGAPFDYEEFMDRGYKSDFSQYTAKDCRRFFLYSPPTQYFRIFYSFDIDCDAQFQNYYVICRYQLPTDMHPHIEDIGRKQDFEEFMQYYDLKAEENTEKISTTTKTSQHHAAWKALVLVPVTIFLYQFWKCFI